MLAKRPRFRGVSNGNNPLLVWRAASRKTFLSISERYGTINNIRDARRCEKTRDKRDTADFILRARHVRSICITIHRVCACARDRNSCIGRYYARYMVIGVFHGPGSRSRSFPQKRCSVAPRRAATRSPKDRAFYSATRQAKDPDTPVDRRVSLGSQTRMPDRRTNLREYLERIESSRWPECPRLAFLSPSSPSAPRLTLPAATTTTTTTFSSPIFSPTCRTVRLFSVFYRALPRFTEIRSLIAPRLSDVSNSTAIRRSIRRFRV